MRLAFLSLALLIFSVAFAQKKKPVITGQKPLTTNEDQPITIHLTDLEVTDRDNWFYPWGFSLQVYRGDHYTVSGETVTPAANFSGTLSVKVTVNDGDHESDPYMLQITVISTNDPPKITGQVSLTTASNTAITIKFSDLTVTDSDDTYPTGFSLIVEPGANYTVNGSTITPAPNFIGTLTVNVKVSDGHSESAPFGLRIQVSDALRITGQKVLTMNEDASLTLQLSDFTVYDPTNTYPTGYALNVQAGTNYSVSGTTVTPSANFNGALTVSVSVAKGSTKSATYDAQLTVTAVNDAPEIVNLETSALQYILGNEAVPLSNTLQVKDVDGNQVVLAEVGFNPEDYLEGGDLLAFVNTPTIRGVFDSKEGVMSLIGNATLEEYQAAIRSITYQFNSEVDLNKDSKVIYFKLNDGETVSATYERPIKMGEVIELDIPNAFTPNSDHTNDTWEIKPVKDSDRLSEAIVRVYNRNGMLVYEGKGFANGWDGNLHGQRLPADTYYYTIDLNLPSTKSNFKGSVTILR